MRKESANSNILYNIANRTSSSNCNVIEVKLGKSAVSDISRLDYRLIIYAFHVYRQVATSWIDETCATEMTNVT